MDCTLLDIEGLGWPYVLESNLSVSEGVTLTVPAGTVVKGGAGYVDITVRGTLDVQGTAANPVVFTSYRDDEHGGDSNGDGPSVGEAGDWGCIRFENGDNVLEHCLMRYGGGSARDALVYLYQCSPTVRDNVIEYSTVHGIKGYEMTAGVISHNTIRECDNYGIYLDESSPTISDNTIRDNGKGGIYLDESSPAITGNCFLVNAIGIFVYRTSNPSVSNNDFVENTDYGIRNDTTSTVAAQQNWWDDSSGPSGSGPGSGDAVSDYVDYSDWSDGPYWRGRIATVSILEDDAVRLSWEGLCSIRYTVLYTDDLTSGEWLPVGGTQWTIADSPWEGDNITGVRQRFYRVMAE